MGLRAADETDTSQYKQFWSYNYTDETMHPYVEVWYQEPQCNLPLEQRTGAWVCDDSNASTTTPPANVTTISLQAQSPQISVASAIDRYCPHQGTCWTQYSSTDSDYHANGVYGWGKQVLGTATFYFEVKMSGAQSTSKPLFFRSTRGTKMVNMEAERFYVSTAHPAGHPVNGTSTYSLYGTISNSGPNTQTNWAPNGYKSYENPTAWVTIVHYVTWTDPSVPGRWYYFAKSIKAKQQSSGAYYFQALPCRLRRTGELGRRSTVRPPR